MRLCLPKTLENAGERFLCCSASALTVGLLVLAGDASDSFDGTGAGFKFEVLDVAMFFVLCGAVALFSGLLVLPIFLRFGTVLKATSVGVVIATCIFASSQRTFVRERWLNCPESPFAASKFWIPAVRS